GKPPPPPAGHRRRGKPSRHRCTVRPRAEDDEPRAGPAHAGDIDSRRGARARETRARRNDPGRQRMRSTSSRLRTLTGALAAGATALAYAAYRRDIKAATQRLETDGQRIDSAQGPIEFAESGDGPAVLLIHGAGGGFD